MLIVLYVVVILILNDVTEYLLPLAWSSAPSIVQQQVNAELRRQLSTVRQTEYS